MPMNKNLNVGQAQFFFFFFFIVIVCCAKIQLRCEFVWVDGADGNGVPQTSYVWLRGNQAVACMWLKRDKGTRAVEPKQLCD